MSTNLSTLIRAGNNASPLPVVYGGTGVTTTPTAGGIVYGNGTTIAYTPAGTTGQVLTSNGASVPTWSSLAGDSSSSINAINMGII